MRSFALLFIAVLPSLFVAQTVPRDQIPFIHFAFNGYEEPEFFPPFEASMGSDYIKRCVKRMLRPEDGDFCRRLPKACFWGEQICELAGNKQPTVRCNCKNSEWSCQGFLCPKLVGTECPAENPSSMDPAPICKTDLTCTYGQERCCDRVFAKTWCTCEAGRPMKCTDIDICRDDCEPALAFLAELIAVGNSRFPSDVNDVLTAGGGGGGANGALCDIIAQDCPDNYKCTVENAFSDTPRCRALDDNADTVGEECDELGNNDGDTCEEDGICLDGVCRQLDTAGTTCSLDEVSHIYPSGARICEEECDPLINAACNSVFGDAHCTRTAGSPDGIFSCFINNDYFNLGGFGDVCSTDAQCQQGSICLSGNAVPFGYCGNNVNCCIPLCDLDEQPSFCAGATGLGGTSCQSIYSNSAPPGLEHVGACTL